MKKLDLVQGSDEWVAARTKYFCASEAAAMLGFDKKTMRNELLHLKSTGMEREFSQWVRENLLDKGHEVEALARPIVEARLGESLDQIVAISDDGLLLASFDGMTMMDDKTWENKLMNRELLAFITENNDLPNTHWPQCEHQAIVSDGAPVFFTVSDGTDEGTIGFWYESKPERRAQILAGWAQFDEDLKNYVPVEVIPAAVATPTLDLPMVSIKTSGSVAVISNLTRFGEALGQFIKNLPPKPSTDQEFADCKAAIGKLKLSEEMLDSEEARAISTMDEVEEMRREKKLYFDLSRTTRLTLEKLVVAREQAIKVEISQEAKDKLAEHTATLNKRLGARLMPEVPANFAEAMKNKRTIASLQNAVDTELARAKIESSAIADRIEINQKAMAEAEAAFLFPDFATVCTKANDDFASLLAARKASHAAAEAERIEKIRAEERARAEAEQARIAKEAAEQAERNRVAAEEIRKLDEQRQQAQEAPALQDVNDAISREFTAALTSVVTTGTGVVKVSADEGGSITAEHVPTEQVVEPGKTIKLGEICAMLGFTVTADFLAGLGVNPSGTERAAKLYPAAKFPTICRLISEHVMALAFKKAA